MDPKISGTVPGALSDILDELYDVRANLEDIFSTMRYIRSELESDLECLLDDFDDLAEQMNDCSCHLLYFEMEAGISSPAYSAHDSLKNTIRSPAVMPDVPINPDDKQQRRKK